MAGRAVHGLLVAAVAVAVGHLAWHTLIGPPLAPEYQLRAEGPALCNPSSAEKQLYLRRSLYLSQRPRHAWLQVLARDRVQVFVNGLQVARQVHDAFPVGVVVDLTPHVDEGHNVIAIVTHQRTVGDPPVVAVRGAYTQSDGEHPIEADALWRCRSIYEWRAHWWFETAFDDRPWPYAQLTVASLCAKVPDPPRAKTEAAVGRWITPAGQGKTPIDIRRQFQVPGRPRQAWLRATSTGSYLLAVNGIPLDERQDQLDTTRPVPPVERSYDITPMVRSGRNVLAFTLTPAVGPPHFLADVEVVDTSGRCVRFGTDAEWLSRQARPADWLDPGRDGSNDWTPCRAEPGDLDIPPWRPVRQPVELSLPLFTAAQRLGGQAALILVLALITAVACRAAAGFLTLCRGYPSAEARLAAAGVAHLALVPATLLIGAGVFATYDPRIAVQDVYRPEWVFLALFSVVLQWLLLGLYAYAFSADAEPQSPPGGWWDQPGFISCLLGVLVAVGLSLRLWQMTAEPLHPDEVTLYRTARALLQEGFPHVVVHEDAPPIYIAGCELESFPPALAALVFREDRTIVRLPSVLLGTLTIVLVYLVGRSLFGQPVGLVAAGLYTLAPACIQMTHFGRYPSLLQWTTLWTIHFFWRTIAGTGPIDTRALWLTVLGFLGMFLSWEASVFMAVGMILAALFQRRGRLETILCNPWVYAGGVVVLAVLLLQLAHGTLQQTRFFLYGTGFSDVKLELMWRYPFYDPLYYVREASWTACSLVPLLGLLGAGLLALRPDGAGPPVRALLLIFLTPCFLMASLLSVSAARYSYHFIPVVILLGSLVLVQGARRLARLACAGTPPVGWRAYGQAVGVGVVLTVVAVGCGLTIYPTGISKVFQVTGTQPGQLRNPHFSGSIAYLRDHFRPGDVVLTVQPEVIDHLVRLDGQAFPSGWSTDYWLQSTLQLQAVLDNHRSIPLHRFSGTVLVPTLESLETIFARHGRIWYITDPPFDSKTNDDQVAGYVREYMEVVYEDFDSVLLLRDNNHRPALKRQEDANAIRKAREDLPP